MSEIDDLKVRMATIEEQVATLANQVQANRADAAAARVLAGAADRDVSEFRAILRNHTQVLNAMNERVGIVEDKVDGLRGEFTSRMDQLDGRIDRLDGHMGQLDGRIDQLDGHMGQLDGRIDRLEAEHGRKLDDHGQKLDEILNLLRSRG
ncbi:hypothetical protein [Longimycelium tulufanense]|uniref:hypothetical protein n=1 Tax=Longimycelium tulufanense TaxID=907463 RepID=UPI00166B6E0E|nr:hypothetical protein [Longimycelium tulufanense]